MFPPKFGVDPTEDLRAKAGAPGENGSASPNSFGIDPMDRPIFVPLDGTSSNSHEFNSHNISVLSISWPASRRSSSEGWCSRRESNSHHRLRRPVHYPLCYRSAFIQRGEVARERRGLSRGFSRVDPIDLRLTPTRADKPSRSAEARLPHARGTPLAS